MSRAKDLGVSVCGFLTKPLMATVAGNLPEETACELGLALHKIWMQEGGGASLLYSNGQEGVVTYSSLRPILPLGLWAS